MKRLIQSVIKATVKLQRYSNRWWYLPAVSFFAALDLFVFVIPTDALVISSVLLKPSRWISTAILISLGSAIGSVALGLVVEHGHGPLFEWLSVRSQEHPYWESLGVWIKGYGFWAVALAALSPFPLPPAVAAAALSDIPIGEIALGVFLGRIPKYGFYAWLSSFAPEKVLKISFLKKELEKMSLAATVERPDQS